MQYVERCSRSESARSCSRIRLPSRSVKRRTQPTWSDGSPFSISDSATSGCHLRWLLKSRRTSHTRSMGASTMAERVTRTMRALPVEQSLQRIEPALKDTLADALGQVCLTVRRAVELGPPFGKCTVSVGDRGELESGHVVLDTKRAFQDRVGALKVVVGQGEELLANDPPILETEVPHAANRVGGQPRLDP